MDKYKGIIAGSILAAFWIGVPAAGVVYVANQDAPPRTVETAPTVSPTLTAEESTYVRNNGTSDCTSDCSGHDAGYEWAEAKGICDPEYDNGNSESFNEGVQAYAYDNCYYEDGSGAF